MERLDELIVSQLEKRVFAADVLQHILVEARTLISDRSASDRQKLARLQAAMRTAEDRLGRLYKAIESGLLPLDETLQRRVQRANAARESVVVEMAGLLRRQLSPVERILPSHVAAFSKVIGAKLRDWSCTFARDYLHAVVDQVVVMGDTATISGSHARLMHAVAQN